MNQEPGRGWWSRHWKWAVPLLCLTPLVGCGGSVAIMFASVFGMLKSSEPYQQAVARAKADKQVVAKFGRPIEEGFFVSGNINYQGSKGHADLAIPISGPRASGTLYAEATRNRGEWKFATLEVDVDGVQERVELIAAETAEAVPVEAVPFDEN